MKRITLILCVIFSCACLWRAPSAQVTALNAIETDSIVDFFSESGGKAGKSSTFAMLSSLVLPGSGHHYLDRNRSALAYFTSEAVAIFGFFLCDHYAKKLALDAAGYAWTHAGAQGTIKNADDNYWKQVGNYMDVQDYNSAIDLNRLEPTDKFTREDQYWRWDGETSKERFNSILSTSRVFRVVSSFCIGALVLDRIIAFIDIRTVTRNYGTKKTGFTAQSITLRPDVSVSSSSDLQLSLQLAGTF